MSMVFRGLIIGALAMSGAACQPESDPTALRYLTSAGSEPPSSVDTSASAGEDSGEDSGDGSDADTGDDSGSDDTGSGDTEVCGYRTQTQGGWGSTCHGDNPGCFRDDNFEATFPEGLRVGCETASATFMNALAVQQALPTGGPPSALEGHEFLDGVGDPKFDTVLVGQAVALQLNVTFSELAGFVAQDLDPFSQLEIAIADSPCLGMSVQEVLDATNLALGGCASILTPQQANKCATALNESFVDGTLECSDIYVTPDTPVSRPDADLPLAGPLPGWRPPR